MRVNMLRVGVVCALLGAATLAVATLAALLHAPRPSYAALPTQAPQPAPPAAPVDKPSSESLEHLVATVSVKARVAAATFADAVVRPDAAPQPHCPPDALVPARAESWLRSGEQPELTRTVRVCVPVRGPYRLRVRRLTGQLPRDSLVRESPLAEEAPYVRVAVLQVHSAAGRFAVVAVAAGVVACEAPSCEAPVHSAAAAAGVAGEPFGHAVLRVAVPEGETAVGVETLDDV